MSKSVVGLFRAMIAFGVCGALAIVALSKLYQADSANTESQLVVSRPYSLEVHAHGPQQQSELQFLPAIGLLDDESAI